jgi:hypothetical protein
VNGFAGSSKKSSKEVERENSEVRLKPRKGELSPWQVWLGWIL